MSDQLGFLTQLIELFTSSVSYGERLDNFVHLLARNLNFDLALFFVLEKEKQRLLLNTSSQGPVSPSQLSNPGQFCGGRRQLLIWGAAPGGQKASEAGYCHPQVDQVSLLDVSRDHPSGLAP